MTPAAYFITGTDTDVGKTRVACAILAAARQQGFSTAALKPVAAGINERGVNADVEALSHLCSVDLSLSDINPVCFDAPIAPHIAAAQAGRVLAASELALQCRPVLDRQADLTLVEGAGGWKVPLNTDETLADLVRALNIPVILVVGMRLGCLNHALLTAQAIAADGAQLAGWIANRIDPDMQSYQDNLETLKVMLPVPLLVEMPWSENTDIDLEIAGKIAWKKLMEL